MFHFRLGSVGGFNKECLDIDVNTDSTSKRLKEDPYEDSFIRCVVSDVFIQRLPSRTVHTGDYDRGSV